jgi:hypothetical protein
MERLFWPLTVAMLACLAATQALSVRQESQTWDEDLEIASGYSYLKTGEYRIIGEHPPLARVLQALPLVFLDAGIPASYPSWQKGDYDQFSRDFLYHNRLPADTILFAARSIAILTTLCLGLAIALWTRSRFGAAAALFALLLFSFDPTVIANGRYAKHDIPVTLFAFLACAAWGAFLRERRISRLFAAGLCFGLALVTKFSALFLIPVFVVLYLVRWIGRREGSGMHFAGSMAAVVVIALAVGAAAYAPYAGMLRPIGRAERLANPSLQMLRDIKVTDPIGRVLTWTGGRLGLQAHPFFTGLAEFATHSSGGHPSYLLGSISENGWWYYFPVAFAVKTPVATLIALILCAVLALRVIRLRKIDFDWYVLFVPVALYMAFTMWAKVDIGIRHLLPIYPFLFIAIGAGLVGMEWKLKKPALLALAGLLVLESAAIYPHYLAFFNRAAGGPGAGPRYLLDSNIDWGQDLKHLKAYMVAHQLPSVCTCYFGRGDMTYYGIEYEETPSTWQAEQRAKVDCVAAISVTPLHDLYVDPGRFAWLRDKKPMATIGYSIYLYDLRKPR